MLSDYWKSQELELRDLHGKSREEIVSCSKDTSACKFTGTINPCCKAHLKEILDNTANILNENEVPWWADYGTLLSLVRNNTFMLSHDDDVDISIERKDLDKFLALTPKFEALGYRVSRDPVDTGLWRVYYSDSNKLHTDVFIWDLQGPHLTRPYWHFEDSFKGKAFPVSWISSFEDILGYKVPKSPERLVEHRYGEDWKTEKKRSEGYKG